MRDFVREFVASAAIEFLHLVTLNGCGRWAWAWRLCNWIELSVRPE